MKRLTYIKVFSKWHQIREVLREKQIHPLHYGHVTHFFLKVNNPETDLNQLWPLLHLLINIKFSFQWYQIRKVLQEKQIHPLHHGHVTHSLKVNNSKMDKNQL